MLRFGKIKKRKNSIKIWDVYVDNIVISKLIETKSNPQYLIGCLDEVTRPLVLIRNLRHVKEFKNKGGDKNKNNKFMPLRIHDDKLLEKYKTVWTKAED